MQSKVIQADLGIFRNIQELFRHTLNPVYPCHIQNPGIFRIMAYLEPGAELGPWYILN